MLRTRVIPCLLLQDSVLVKTVKFKNPTYVGDPINTVRIFNEQEVDELVVLGIDVTKNRQEPPYDLIQEIASECFMPFAYGGGIRTLDQAKRLFILGVEKVIINSAAIETPKLISEISRDFGAQSIIVSIDAKKQFFGGYKTYGCGGTSKTAFTPAEFAKKMEALGAGEILIYSMDKDGTFSGYDIPLIRDVSDAVSLPVIACGGAKTLQDLKQAVDEGHASAAGVGSMVVYQGENRSVLINFPAPQELHDLFHSTGVKK